MAVEELINDLLNHPEADVRRSSAEELSLYDSLTDEIISALTQGLLDTDSGIKDICSRTLSEPDEYDAEDVAISVVQLIAHSDIETRNLASDILKRIGTPAIPSLLPYLVVDDNDIRQFTVEILGGIGDESALPYLFPLLEDPVSNIKNAAIEAIGNLQSTGAIDTLISMYDNEEELKLTIIESIGKIGTKKGEEFLISILRVEQDLLLKTACIDALAFTGENISICYKLLEELPTTLPELQVVLLKTIYAISYRLEEKIELPAELRYVAHKALSEDDIDLRGAGLVALGDQYYSEDISSIVSEVLRKLPDTQQLILTNLLGNSSPEVVKEFFGQYCFLCNRNMEHFEFLSLIPVVWEYASLENRLAVIEKNTELVFSSDSGYSLEIIDVLLGIDTEEVINNMLIFAQSEDIDKCNLMLDAITEYARYEFLPVLELIAKQEGSVGERARLILSDIS